MPISPIASQARCLDTIDSANITRADHRHQPLEPRTPRATRSRTSKIVIYHGYAGEAYSTGSLRKIVLPALTFEVPGNLCHGRLTDIDHRSSAKMVRRDFTAHPRLRSRSMVSPPVAHRPPPVAARPLRRSAPACPWLLAARKAGGSDPAPAAPSPEFFCPRRFSFNFREENRAVRVRVLLSSASTLPNS